MTGKVPPHSDSSGPFVMDLTWVSDLTGWALSADRCAAGLCPEVATTTDGGQTWHPLPNPPASIQNGTVDCASVACVSYLRFATTMLGYLYGPALLLTSDGGRSWRPQAGLPVDALEPTQVGVYRIVYDHGGCPGPCDRTVEVAPSGSGTWRTVATIPFSPNGSRQVTAELVPQGGQDIYIPIYGDVAAGAGTQQAILWRSLDAGHTWRQLGDPCGAGGTGANVAIGVAAAAGGFVAALCIPRSSRGGEFVVTSNNAGSSWGPPHPVPGPFIQLIAAPGSAFLGFEDSLFGRWVGSEGAIWTSGDGGAHWLRRPFQ